MDPLAIRGRAYLAKSAENEAPQRPLVPEKKQASKLQGPLHPAALMARQETAMATGLQNEQKELADYIRAGSARGHQCFGSYFDDKGGSCALGAVYEGVYHLPREHGKLIPEHLERLFRCLDEVTKRCPQGCEKRLPLAAMIVHLNDDHRMTREQIAEWLSIESNG
jgi:hypothetical protein